MTRTIGKGFTGLLILSATLVSSGKDGATNTASDEIQTPVQPVSLSVTADISTDRELDSHKHDHQERGESKVTDDSLLQNENILNQISDNLDKQILVMQKRKRVKSTKKRKKSPADNSLKGTEADKSDSKRHRHSRNFKSDAKKTKMLKKFIKTQLPKLEKDSREELAKTIVKGVSLDQLFPYEKSRFKVTQDTKQPKHGVDEKKEKMLKKFFRKQLPELEQESQEDLEKERDEIADATSDKIVDYGDDFDTELPDQIFYLDQIVNKSKVVAGEDKSQTSGTNQDKHRKTQKVNPHRTEKPLPTISQPVEDQELLPANIKEEPPPQPARNMKPEEHFVQNTNEETPSKKTKENDNTPEINTNADVFDQIMNDRHILFQLMKEKDRGKTVLTTKDKQQQTATPEIDSSLPERTENHPDVPFLRPETVSFAPTTPSVDTDSSADKRPPTPQVNQGHDVVPLQKSTSQTTMGGDIFTTTPSTKLQPDALGSSANIPATLQDLLMYLQPTLHVLQTQPDLQSPSAKLDLQSLSSQIQSNSQGLLPEGKPILQSSSLNQANPQSSSPYGQHNSQPNLKSFPYYSQLYLQGLSHESPVLQDPAAKEQPENHPKTQDFSTNRQPDLENLSPKGQQNLQTLSPNIQSNLQSLAPNSQTNLQNLSSEDQSNWQSLSSKRKLNLQNLSTKSQHVPNKVLPKLKGLPPNISDSSPNLISPDGPGISPAHRKEGLFAIAKKKIAATTAEPTHDAKANLTSPNDLTHNTTNVTTNWPWQGFDKEAQTLVFVVFVASGAVLCAFSCFLAFCMCGVRCIRGGRSDVLSELDNRLSDLTTKRPLFLRLARMKKAKSGQKYAVSVMDESNFSVEDEDDGSSEDEVFDVSNIQTADKKSPLAKKSWVKQTTPY